MHILLATSVIHIRWFPHGMYTEYETNFLKTKIQPTAIIVYV